MNINQYIDLLDKQVEEFRKLSVVLPEKYKTAKEVLKNYISAIDELPKDFAYAIGEELNISELCSREEAVEMLVDGNRDFEVIDVEYLMNIRFIKSLIIAHQDTIMAYKISKRINLKNEIEA